MKLNGLTTTPKAQLIKKGNCLLYKYSFYVQVKINGIVDGQMGVK